MLFVDRSEMMSDHISKYDWLKLGLQALVDASSQR
jgi:hypothetical protein